MDERGYTNYRLAKLLDCSQSTVAHWLDGSTKPQRATMKRIAQQFGVSVESLSGKEKPAAQGDELDDLGTMLRKLNPQNLAVVEATVQALLSAQSEQDSHG